MTTDSGRNNDSLFDHFLRATCSKDLAPTCARSILPLRSTFMGNCTSSSDVRNVPVIGPQRRSVYVLIRPVHATQVFLSLQEKTHKRFYVCHTGILVTDSNIRDLLIVNDFPDYGHPGTFWEIYRTKRETNMVRELTAFSLSDARGDWGTFGWHYVGTTTATNTSISRQG
jgi:hypothetical protein